MSAPILQHFTVDHLPPHLAAVSNHLSQLAKYLDADAARLRREERWPAQAPGGQGLHGARPPGAAATERPVIILTCTDCGVPCDPVTEFLWGCAAVTCPVCTEERQAEYVREYGSEQKGGRECRS